MTLISTARVTGQFVVGVVDGADPDDEPDIIPAKGTITFSGAAPYVPLPDALPNPVTLMTTSIMGVLDAEGFLCTPDPVDPSKAGVRGVRLFANDDPLAPVKNWTWTVTYRFGVVNGTTPTIPSHSIALLSGSEVDLTKVVKVPSSPGVGVDQALALTERAEASARQAATDAAVAQSVRDDADAGVFDGDKLTMGAVTSVAAGGTPTASLTGTSPDKSLNLGLVKGDKGDTGDRGPQGAPGTDGTADDLSMAAVAADPGSDFAGVLKSSYGTSFVLSTASMDTTGVADVTVKLQARINAAPDGALCVLPYGTYKVSNTITLRSECSYDLRGATIRAGAAIAGPLVDTPAATSMMDQSIQGGIFDCNNLAQIGFWSRLSQNSTFRNLAVWNTANHGFIFGDTGTTRWSAEVMVYGLHVWKPYSEAPTTAGSIGMWMQQAADSEINGVVVVGNDIGIRNDKPDNRLFNCHIWGYFIDGSTNTDPLPRIGFELNDGTELVGCCADSCKEIGFHFKAGTDSALLASIVVTSPSQADNTAIGAKIDSGVGRVAAFGNKFWGRDSSTRLAADWVDEGFATTILGQSTRSAASRVGINNFPEGDVFGTPIQDKIHFVTPDEYPPGSIVFTRPTHVTRVTSVAGSGTGARFHLERAGTPLTPVVNIGDMADVDFILQAGQSAYIVMDSVGTGVSQVSVVAGGYVLLEDATQHNG